MTVDRLVFRLYIIIGANPELNRPDQNPLAGRAVGTFFNETAELWSAVVSADATYRRPMGPSTAHHLMESYNRLLPFDPGRVLHLTWWLITGRTLGYHFDASDRFLNWSRRQSTFAGVYVSEELLRLRRPYGWKSFGSFFTIRNR